MALVSIISSVGASPGLTSDKSSVALRAKLDKCIQQLGDWQACPSSKTQEGKKIIGVDKIFTSEGAPIRAGQTVPVITVDVITAQHLSGLCDTRRHPFVASVMGR